MPDPPRRRWLRIGPGLIVAVVLAGVLWSREGRFARPVSRRATVAEARLTDPVTPVEPPAAEPGWLLSRAETIGLTAEQRTTLTALAGGYAERTNSDRAALDAAAASFSGYLGERAERGAAGEEAVRDHGREVSELSASLAVARGEAWAEATALLTDEQQATVRELRRAAPLEMR